MNRLLSCSVVLSTVVRLVSLVAVLHSCPMVSAQAATNTISIQYNTSWDASDNPKEPELNAKPAPATGVALATTLSADIHVFDIYMTITGLPPGEDFQSAVFDVVLGPGVTPKNPHAHLNTYHGNDLLYDPPPNTGTCPSGCLPVFSANSDAGANSGDLKTITVRANEADNFAGTHLRHPGEVEAASSTDPDNFNLAGPMYLGSIFVRWNFSLDNGVLPKSFVGLADPENLATAWTSVDSNNVVHSFTAADMNQGPQSQWTTAPEPSILLLLGIGAISLLGYRKPKS